MTETSANVKLPRQKVFKVLNSVRYAEYLGVLNVRGRTRDAGETRPPSSRPGPGSWMRAGPPRLERSSVPHIFVNGAVRESGRNVTVDVATTGVMALNHRHGLGTARPATPRAHPLANYHEDNSATCAFVMPSTVDDRQRTPLAPWPTTRTGTCSGGYGHSSRPYKGWTT